MGEDYDYSGNLRRAQRSDARRALEICAAKIGEPYMMRECGRELVYRVAGESGVTYEGWYHKDAVGLGHHGVPRSAL